MKINVTRISEEEIKKKGVRKWPVWTKEISEFDWHYETDEDCLLLEGRVQVETEGGSVTEFGAGDFVSFPQGMSCRWMVLEPVRKHYRLG